VSCRSFFFSARAQKVSREFSDNFSVRAALVLAGRWTIINGERICFKKDQKYKEIDTICTVQ